jgi:hypothetical protein
MGAAVTMLGYATVWAVIGGIVVVGLGIATVVVVVVALGITIAVARAAKKGARRTRPNRRRRATANRDYLWINLGQFVLLALAALVLVMVGEVALIPLAACVVVGLHFFPLAWTYDQPQFWATGAAMLVLAAAAIVLVVATGAGPGASIGLVAIGSAVVLWATAFALTVRG